MSGSSKFCESNAKKADEKNSDEKNCKLFSLKTRHDYYVKNFGMLLFIFFS